MPQWARWKEAAVNVACSTLCFASYPLDRALRIIGELEFTKLDVAIHEDGSHLKPSEVAQDVVLAAARIRIGPSITPGALNVRIAETGDAEYQRQLRAICRLARMSTVSVITIPAAPAGTDLDTEVKRLTELVKVAELEGIVLTVATHTGTLTELPDTAVTLCERVRGLGLTLDPSHYVAGPLQGGSYDRVYPFVRHVHLRDTGRGPGQFQVRVGQGEIEYGRIIAQLARFRYDRLLTVAIHDIPDAPFAMEAEVRKLKYLLESLV
jgi:sugar phosphate isomerase/epimerase